MSWIDVAGHLSFVLTATSFALRDMLLLRGVSVLSGIIGLIYNYNLPGGPLWLVIFWLLVFMTINLVQVVRLLSERRRTALSEEEQQLAETVLQHFSARELSALLGMARRETLAPGQVILSEGDHADSLVLLISGEADVVRGSAAIARAGSGAFLGEMGFLSEGPASATVVAATPCRCLVWSSAQLRQRLGADPVLRAQLQHTLSTDLSAKLMAAA